MAKKRHRSKKNQLKITIPPETLNSIIAVVLMLFGLMVMVSFSGQGMLLQKINSFFIAKLGLAMLILPFVFISAGLAMLRAKWSWSKPHVLLGTLLLMLAILGVGQTGEVGEALFTNLATLLSPVGTFILFLATGLIGFLVMTNWSIVELAKFLAKKKTDKEATKEANDLFSSDKKSFNLPRLQLGNLGKKSFEINDARAEVEPIEEKKSVEAVAPITAEKKPVEGRNLLKQTSLVPNNTPVLWEYPSLELLSNKPGGKAQRGDVKTNAQIIENTLDSFGIKAKVAEVNYGPAVTQYALKITEGTRLSKITSLATDLALALAAPTGQIRVEAPIAGRS